MTDVPPDPAEGTAAARPPAAPPPTAPPAPSAPPPPPPGYGEGPRAGVATTPGLYFDQVSGLNLPDGTELASVGRRIGSWFLAIPLAIVTLGIGYLIWGLIVWGRGQTPTQQVLGMRTWHPQTARHAGWWRMVLREVIGGFVTGILGIITEVVSFVLMVSGRERRCLADHIASTVVLRDPDNRLAGHAAPATA
jgi:RDD family